MCIKGNKRVFLTISQSKIFKKILKIYTEFIFEPVYTTQRKLGDLRLSGEILDQCESIQPYYNVK